MRLTTISKELMNEKSIAFCENNMSIKNTNLWSIDLLVIFTNCWCRIWLTPDRAEVKKEEVAVDDLQNKVSFGVSGGGSGRILRWSSQLFWSTEMEYSNKNSAEFWKEEESLEKIYLEDPFYRWSL